MPPCHIMRMKKITWAQIWRRQKNMFERPGDPNCPVPSLEKYLAKLNPFFQRPKTNLIYNSNCSYDNVAMGRNTLGNKMMISAKSKWSSLFTNHCIRATAVNVLAPSGILHRDICSMTGWRTVDSLHPCTAVQKTLKAVKWIIFHNNMGHFQRPRISWQCQQITLQSPPSWSKPIMENVQWRAKFGQVWLYKTAIWQHKYPIHTFINDRVSL